MPLTIRGTVYQLPTEDGRSGPTGLEIDEIETHFNVDYQDLSILLVERDPEAPPIPKKPGVTQNRALYGFAWIAVHRVEPQTTIEDVMAFGIEELIWSKPVKPKTQRGKVGAEGPKDSTAVDVATASAPE